MRYPISLRVVSSHNEVRHIDPSKRGIIPLYYRDQANHCPGCGRMHWYVGRMSAECAFCGAALPLAPPHNGHCK